MKVTFNKALAGLVSFMLGIVIAENAIGQQKAPPPPPPLKQQIVGTWTLVSVYDQLYDGKKLDTWGPNVKGSASYDRSGRFTYMIVAAGRKRSDAGPLVPVGKSIGYFGTYSVNEEDRTITWRIERSTYPNWDGVERKGKITIKGDQLSIVSAPASLPEGTIVPHLEWKRAK
jgi:hypothetical protein